MTAQELDDFATNIRSYVAEIMPSRHPAEQLAVFGLILTDYLTTFDPILQNAFINTLVISLRREKDWERLR